jgi:hypothetical protein
MKYIKINRLIVRLLFFYLFIIKRYLILFFLALIFYLRNLWKKHLKYSQFRDLSKHNFYLPSNINLNKYVDSYFPSENFTGPKEGFIFKTDKKGTGYYKDNNSNSNKKL